MSNLAYVNADAFLKTPGMMELKCIMPLEAWLILVVFIAINLIAEHGYIKAAQFRSLMISQLADPSRHCGQALAKGRLMLDLTRDKMEPTMAWGVFPLGKEFLFSFIGFLIPCIVLIAPKLIEANGL
ncbi:hypothetical protein HDE_03504 [Halotydeus destructor]|nr:hypothetical protein HDE_03504 [Halotydeus destructor]